MPDWNLNRVERAFAEAAVNPALWVKALDIVTAETDGVGAILLPASGNALPNVPFTANMAASIDTYFRDRWYLRDERYRGLPTLMKTGVADDFDAMSADQIRRHPYYQEFLASHGLRWYAGVRVSCGDDLWVLSIQRSKDQEPFSPEEKRKLARLSRSLPGSIAIARAIGNANGEDILEAFEFSRTAGALINGHGRVIRPNESAERLLSGDVRICTGRIVSSDVGATAALDRALQKILHSENGAGLANPVRLPRKGRRPLLAYAGRLSTMIANPLSDCQAIVIFVDPDSRSLPHPAILRSAFDLTEAEARIAAHLGSGASLENVCDRLEIAKDTGRNHLKNIFAKTETHRQAELAVLLNMVLGSSNPSG